MWRRSRGRPIRRTNAAARRSEDWNVGLAEDLRDPAFAREFLLAAIDEGVDLQVALGKVIRAMGVKEFAAQVRMASPNVLRAINPRHNPTRVTLDRLLKPFGLRLSLAPHQTQAAPDGRVRGGMGVKGPCGDARSKGYGGTSDPQAAWTR